MPAALSLHAQLEQLLPHLTKVIAAAKREKKDKVAQDFTAVRQYIYKYVSQGPSVSIPKDTPYNSNHPSYDPDYPDGVDENGEKIS
jgi:hypothetical protein